MFFCVLIHNIQPIYEYIQQTFSQKLYFEGTKSFPETLDVGKTEVKKMYILILHPHLNKHTKTVKLLECSFHLRDQFLKGQPYYIHQILQQELERHSIDISREMFISYVGKQYSNNLKSAYYSSKKKKNSKQQQVHQVQQNIKHLLFVKKTTLPASILKYCLNNSSLTTRCVRKQLLKRHSKMILL